MFKIYQLTVLSARGERKRMLAFYFTRKCIVAELSIVQSFGWLRLMSENTDNVAGFLSGWAYKDMHITLQGYERKHIFQLSLSICVFTCHVV